MQIPVQLVPAMRNALQNEGLDPNIVGYNGEISGAGLVGLAFDTVTVRTAVTPDLVFPISASGAPPSRGTQELLNQLQPTVILSGRAGDYTLAPYGQAKGQTSWLPLVLIGGGALAFLAWAMFGD